MKRRGAGEICAMIDSRSVTRKEGTALIERYGILKAREALEEAGEIIRRINAALDAALEKAAGA